MTAEDRTTRGSGARPAGRPRLFYVAGPGDVAGTYDHWRAGRDDPSQVAMTYSGQFYDACRDLDAEGYAVSTNPRAAIIRDGPFRVENRPPARGGGRGLAYHANQSRYVLGLVASALRFRADAAVVGAIEHWPALAPLRLRGIRVIPTLHCTLWPKLGRPKAVQRLSARFFRHTAAAILSASAEITRQVEELTGGRHAPIIEFLPSYRPGRLQVADAPPAPPFRVLYAGRIERSKGVFDLLAIAARFAAEGRPIEFDLCGTGGALPELRARVAEAGLGAAFRLHGHCDQGVMRGMFEGAHAVVVPTTSHFIEGFNQVVAEGVLAGKPVVTSAICPALEYVREAAVEVPPDDVDAYAGAILRLAGDPALYGAKRAACVGARAQFFDLDRGWAAALKRALGPGPPAPGPAPRPGSPGLADPLGVAGP